MEMKAKKLYKSLEDQFELDKFEREEWGFSDEDDYITESFKEKGMGVVLDNTEEIQKVYTAVFPSEHVLDQLLASGERDILLFTHHAVIWDTSTGGFPFRKIPSEYLEKLRINDQRSGKMFITINKINVGMMNSIFNW